MVHVSSWIDCHICQLKDYVSRNKIDNKTSMQSSRMCAARLLTVSESMGGGGVCIKGSLHPGGSASKGVCIQRLGRPHKCKNITLPQASFAGGNYCNGGLFKCFVLLHLVKDGSVCSTLDPPLVLGHQHCML